MIQWWQLWFVPRFFLLESRQGFLGKKIVTVINEQHVLLRSDSCWMHSLVHRRTEVSGSCKSQGDVGQGCPINNQWLCAVAVPVPVCCTCDAGFVSCFVCPAWPSLDFPYFCIIHPQCRGWSWIQKTTKLLFLHVDILQQPTLPCLKVLSSQASLHSIYHRRSVEGQGRETGRVQQGILNSTIALGANRQESQKEEDTMRC